MLYAIIHAIAERDETLIPRITELEGKYDEFFQSGDDIFKSMENGFEYMTSQLTKKEK